MYKIFLFTVAFLTIVPHLVRADTTVNLFDLDKSESPTTRQWTFTLPPYPAEQQVLLGMDARIDWPTLGGSNPWMRVAINGNFLTKENLHNKLNNFKMSNGVEITWSSKDRWRVLYSPDFKAASELKDDPMSILETDPYRLVWDISRFAKPGKNELQIVNLQILAKSTTLVLRNATVKVGNPTPPPVDPSTIVTPAPTGPLPVFIDQGARQVPMQVRSAPGVIQLNVAGQQFNVTTRTSLPAGKWQEPETQEDSVVIRNGQTKKIRWTTSIYSIQRQIEVLSDHIHISDTYTNTTNQLIGVMLENRLQYPSKPEHVLVAGVETASDKMQTNSANNPSVFAQWKQVGVGLVAEDDIYRVQVQNLRNPQGMSLNDNRLGIEPGKSVTLEWSIYPVPHKSTFTGDYWDFVNAVRRNWDVNYTIPGPFSFTMSFNRETKRHDVDWYGQWMRSRDLKIVAGGIAKYANGLYAHGTGILFAPEFVASEKDWISKVHQGKSDIKALCYFNAQITTEPDGETKYAADRLRDLNGTAMSYPGKQSLPVYLAMKNNTYGKALWGYVHTCLDTIGADGLYWDEMSHSMLDFTMGEPWDGHTVQIHPKTHAVTAKISSVALLMQSLRLDIVHYLRDHNKYLMANTQAETRTMMREKIVRFVETISTYSALSNTNLGCPLGLGNHMRNASTPAADAHNVREMLKRGAVYYGWVYNRDAAPWNFTSVMYPITPERLGAGFVIGKERIHTTISGRFGFSDGAPADVYVVDANGARVAKPNIKEMIENKKYFYDVRIPSDQFAVLVKKEI